MYTTRNIINKFPYLELRLFSAIIVAVIIIISDSKFNAFLPFRNYIEDSIYLFYDLCHRPVNMYNFISKIISGYTRLILENKSLHKELYLKNSALLLLDQYKQENYKLHNLLKLPVCKTYHKLVTKIFFINIDTYTEYAIINQGTNHGVYIGQPVISDCGIVGQIVSANKISSKILLISDRKHALSVKLKRTNMRMILVGRGHHLSLYAEYSGNIDIHINDMLITSGLDDRFPEGYPVALVSDIDKNIEKDLTIIKAKPIVKLQCLDYVVLIFK